MSSDWQACEGYRQASLGRTGFGLNVSRRGVLMGLGMGMVGWLASSPALSQISIKPGRKNGKVLVDIFLRGGMDGLNVVIPYGEDAYHRLRPGLGIAKKDLLDLDGFFGLNKVLEPILPLFKDGKMALVHAVGSDDQTRSHCEAMSAMERGLPKSSSGSSSGWLARHLETTPSDAATPLRAVALGSTMPDSLKGATQAIAMESIMDYRLGSEDETYRAALADLYGSHRDPYGEAGHATLEVLQTLKRLDPKAYKPDAVYPKTDLATALSQVAFLIKAGVGLEVAALDRGGWDTHVAQAQWLALNLDDLGKSLAAFYKDLGPETSRVTVVVQTEFGRRAAENSGLGTDHGRASVMFVAGGAVKGGKVYADWPGLEERQLEQPGDLRVTTDYRSPLAEILAYHGNPNAGGVFPGFEGKPLGLL